MNIISGDAGSDLDKLKSLLTRRDHPISTINYSFLKLYQPKVNPDCSDVVIFTSTFNPNHQYDRKIVTNLFEDINSDRMNKAFGRSKIITSTRQPKSLRNILIQSKYTSSKKPVVYKEFGLFNCNKCIYHETGYINHCSVFRFGKSNTFSWRYSRYFDCDAKNVIYVLKCFNCWQFYIGETGVLKSRISKHKSDVNHPDNSYCKKLMLHLRNCFQLQEPYFNIYPIYYVDNQARRRFIEKRFIKYFQPSLNSDN